MSSEKKVKLKRRELLNGYIDALTPENITNSGKSDGGWMDSIGVRAAGLGHILDEVIDPMEKFISNNAYGRPGFATLQFDLCPPLELSCNKPTKRENLTKFLKDQIYARESSFYKAGQFTVDESYPRIDNPKGMSNGTTNADIIVTYWYERPVENAPCLPDDLTAKEQYAALYFSGRGIVIIQCTNFARHDEDINVMDILKSVRYKRDAPYFGHHALNPATLSLAFAQCPRSPTNGMPKICFQCGETKSESNVKRCSR